MSTKVVVDIVERTLWTAIQAFCGAWIVTQRLDATSLKIAGAAAAVAAAKCVIATRVGDSDSAAAIPGHTG